ncbi:MAG: amino acid adenylation domain-containing protein, partial [Pikeienuella sp.]
MDDVLDLYEMTPAQAGMLFQSLYAPEDGAYLQQYWGRLEGDLDIGAFRAAWDAVIARHDILRAGCHWEGLDRPALVIHAAATPAWRVEDWSGDTRAAQEARLRSWLAEDRAHGFDLAAPPLTRFALIRLGPDAHVFVWSFHHLLLDGWCGALLVREMLEIYGGAPPRPAPPPFRAYAEWLEAQARSAAETYWREALSGIEGPTPLGIDRAETGEQGLWEHRFRLGPALTRDLSASAREGRLTLPTLMQGAWALVLSRYAGREDVTFGMVLSGRPADLPGAEDMVGLFLQTVPARINVAPGAAPGPWLAAIQAEQRQRETHGHAPLGDIQRWSGAGGSALFESLLIVETYPESIETAVSRGAKAVKLTETGVHERTNFPLTLKVLPGEDIEICIAAEAARLPAATGPRLAGHLAEALKGLVAHAPTLDGIGMLAPEERAALKTLGQGPRIPSPPLALDRLLAQARDRAAHPAVETAGGEGLDHAGLMRRAGEIAAALRGRGIGRGDIVAICQDRTPDLLATLIAAWRCGAAYLPLDPVYPADRIAYILGDAGAAVAVVDDIGRAALGPQDGPPVLMVADCAGDAASPDRVAPDDLAYILYTSGSTGRPKGVPITHAALANFLASTQEAPGIGPDDRWLALTTVAFDIAALELFGPLTVGGTVVLAGAGAGMDGGALARLIEECRISVAQATPAGWRVLRDSGWKGAPGLKILSGGEALDSALARDLLDLGGALWNLYGPTETTIWSAALRVRPEHLSRPKVPVGGPLAETTLSLRDERGRPMPVGAAGELWIGGAGLSPGYLGRPDLTADRFVAEAGALFYRTGDRMRLNADGTLDFLGRLDDQVKLRGYRIELGEIEARLETHPDITEAVAMVRGEGGSARLVAYLRPESAPPAKEIRAHLADALPAYMIPSAYLPLARFPLTPNGKIDRKALPAPGATRAAGGRLSQREEILAGIWAEALEAERIGPEDDFFALGGHSLLALRVIGEIRRRLDVDLSLRDLFDAPVFERFCARVGEGRAAPPPVAPSGGAPVLSAAQHRQWLLSRLAPGRADYHLPLAVRLTGPLDAGALERAFARLAARHDILRCRFPAERGVASVVIDGGAPALRRDDPGGGAQGEALARIRQEEDETPFDMEAAPPWRLRLARLSDEEHVLFVTLHHILADEWSFGVMLEELRADYPGDAAAAKPAVQYPDFAAWQNGHNLAPQRDYWRGRLAGAPALARLPA